MSSEHVSSELQTPASVEGVASLHHGENHNASWGRSYNSASRQHRTAESLAEEWNKFLLKSLENNRRRAVMLTLISEELFAENVVPIEASIRLIDPNHDDLSLVWIGQNQHRNIANQGDSRYLPMTESVELNSAYTLDFRVTEADVDSLTCLWEQFGWTREAVQAFVLRNANDNPIVVIRQNGKVVGAMIAESMEFGDVRLVELTELAVDPDYRGQHLAVVLIRELSQMCAVRWPDAVIFGEFNQTTGAERSAARAGFVPALRNGVDGVLRDHVGVVTGEGNGVEDQELEWLHNFLVMSLVRSLSEEQYASLS